MAKLGEVLKAKTVKWKLSFMSKMMIGIMSILGLGALLGAFVLNSQTRELSNNWMVANNIIADLDYLTSEFRLKQYHHIVSETDEEYNQIEKEVEEINQKIEGQMQAYRSTIQSDVDRQYFEHAYTAWQEYIEVSGSSVFMASREGNLTKAKNIMTEEGYKSFSVFQTNFDELLNFNLDQANKATVRAQLAFLVVIIVVILFVAIGILISTCISKMIIQSIAQPVEELMVVTKEMTEGNLHAPLYYKAEDELGILAESMRITQRTLSEYIEEISDALREIAKGDLTKDFKEITDFKGDFGSIKESFVFILREFNDTLTQIQDNSVQVESGSNDIAGAAADLASGTTEQASAVEELTATINTVNNMAEESAKRAEESYQEVLVSVKNAETEKRQMQELQEEMARIKEISNEVEAIIGLDMAVPKAYEDYKINMPIVIDVEESANTEKTRTRDLTKEQRTKNALAFVRKMQENGYYVGVYANLDWFTNYLDKDAIGKECELWIAHYNDNVDYKDTVYGMWQYTDKGEIDGITDEETKTPTVDLNICYKDYPTIIKNGGYNGFEKPTLEPSGIKGDINADGITNLDDVVVLAQYVAGWNIIVSADGLNLNGDAEGKVDLDDVVWLAQSVAGWNME